MACVDERMRDAWIIQRTKPAASSFVESVSPRRSHSLRCTSFHPRSSLAFHLRRSTRVSLYRVSTDLRRRQVAMDAVNCEAPRRSGAERARRPTEWQTVLAAHGRRLRRPTKRPAEIIGVTIQQPAIRRVRAVADDADATRRRWSRACTAPAPRD